MIEMLNKALEQTIAFIEYYKALPRGALSLNPAYCFLAASEI